MKERAWIEWVSYAIGASILVYTWIALIPVSPLADPLNPAYFATLAAVITVPGVIVFWAFLSKYTKLERLIFAVTLTFMPLIYLWAALLSGDRMAVAVEVAGLVIFGAIAWLGLLRSTLLIGIGIAAHGLAWDSWHHHQATYIEAWYPLGCAAFDVAFGLMIAARSFNGHAGPVELQRVAARP